MRKIRRRSFDDVAFAEFDRNFIFVLDDILHDVVVRLKNQGNCSIHCSGRTGSGPKLNALNQVRPS